MPYPDCEHCGVEVRFCECLSGKGNVDDLDRVVIAYRSLTDKTVKAVGSHWYSFGEAMRKAEELNRVYDGKVRHFVVAPEYTFA
jgi:hypothetical protein